MSTLPVAAEQSYIRAMSDNRETVIGLYEAFGRGDLDGVVAAVADNVDWGLEPGHPALEVAPWLANVGTKNELSGYFGGLGEAAEFHDFHPIAIGTDGDHVMSLVHEDFTVRATGKHVVTTAAHHFTFGPDGRIARYRPIVDSTWESGFRNG